MPGHVPAHPLFDMRLRLTPELEALYEAEHHDERCLSIQHSLVVGLVLYNIHTFTGALLLRDVFEISAMLRLVVVTPASLLFLVLLPRLGGPARERLLVIAVLNAFFLPLAVFWTSTDPNSPFAFAEFTLTLVFACMSLPLRFVHAAGFTLLAFVGVAGVVSTKPGLSEDVVLAFLLQFGTGCVLTLYANGRTESLRCRSFLRELDVRREVVGAEARSDAFKHLSHVDALTGLPNRRVLDLTSERWFAEDRQLAMLMIDVDFFKLYNDRLGHPQGDECLRAIGRSLQDLAQASGCIAARFGGEEFTFLVQGLSQLEAARLAGDLVERIRALAIPHPGRSDGLGIVTASVGLAWVDHPRVSSPALLLATSDEALYRAKRRGRNQWAMADALKAEPPLEAASV
ncbi:MULTISPECIES: sensor domain-containing diguanylate cyclase [unclassified Aureimonas]|uniref:GGDEF domain-containing protein n=1 Tax=unclassified Aureimonas TaxID=2615206 RepID=UPI0012E3EBE0|nr:MULTISPECIES: GGDEF domain-containing protein [unclassified Aureimonas]